MIYDSCNLCFYLLLKFNICLLATKLCSRYPSLRLCGKKFLVVFWMGKYLFMNNHHCLLLLQSKTSKAHLFWGLNLYNEKQKEFFVDKVRTPYPVCFEFVSKCLKKFLINSLYERNSWQHLTLFGSSDTSVLHYDNHKYIPPLYVKYYSYQKRKKGGGGEKKG